MICQYCESSYEKRGNGFNRTCENCEQEIVDAQMPFIEEALREREIIADCEKKIDELWEKQKSAIIEIGNELEAREAKPS